MAGCVLHQRVKEERELKNSLSLRPDLSVHYSCSGDAASQWVDLEQATHG